MPRSSASRKPRAAPARRSKSNRRRPPADVLARARRVRLVLLDVDGVLTADRVLVDARGAVLRVLSMRDVAAVKLLARAGIRVALLAERSTASTRLARLLGVGSIAERVTTGVAAARRLCRRAGVTPAELAFVGDDLLDQPLFAFAGFAVNVGDGARGLARHVHWTTSAPGGGGAVREVAELLLQSQGKWASVLGESMR